MYLKFKFVVKTVPFKLLALLIFSRRYFFNSIKCYFLIIGNLIRISATWCFVVFFSSFFNLKIKKTQIYIFKTVDLNQSKESNSLLFKRNFVFLVYMLSLYKLQTSSFWEDVFRINNLNDFYLEGRKEYTKDH